MKKSIFLVVFSFLWQPSFSCAWWEPDYEYYNLFVQTNINSPVYFPFLLTESSQFYYADPAPNIPNENIEDWQRYFKIQYNQAEYLVFNASRETIQELAKGKAVSDRNLSFADSDFRTKYKQALLYLAYAKYLEPYMAYNRDGDAEDNYYWDFQPEKTVGDLDYAKVIDVLTKSWNAETDKDLKLRYGYQLVRFAHYSRKFQEAINYFNQYVESLNYKTIMYYYAVDQKGGAERALGNYMQANYDFFQFFSHTKNKKSTAYTSMKITQDLDFQTMLKKPMTDDEKFDLYLLMGYHSFNNPLAEMKKIVAISPDAVQAKVLMARAVNQLERSLLPVYYSCPYDDETYQLIDGCFDRLKDKRLPVITDSKIQSQLNTAIQASLSQTKTAKDKDFWNLTTAYLYFLTKDFQNAQTFLNKIDTKNSAFGEQKELFTMLIEIASQPVIDGKFEKLMMSKYKNFFVKEQKNTSQDDEYWYNAGNTSKDFVFDILANRYHLQNDDAKSFLLQNNVTAFEFNPDLNLFNEVEKFYYKKDKNEFELYLLKKINDGFIVDNKLKNQVAYNFESWAANFKGTMALTKGDFQTALSNFKNVDPKFSLRGGINGYDDNWNPIHKESVYNGFSNISENVFGFNKIECFECPEKMVMQTDFLKDFPIIKKKMNKTELTEALIELNSVAGQNGEMAAKANYLMANFFFNTTTLGYFRELLTFDINNSNGEKFHSIDFGSLSYPLYFKNYEFNPNYIDQFDLPLNYADAALSKTNSDELKAQILFTASKCEQGIFYKAMDTDQDLLRIDFSWDQSDKYEKAMLDVKTTKYRKYFKELKKYQSTAFYDEVKSNCKYFNYYSSHY